MSTAAASCVSRISETLISTFSAVVFFLQDILDGIMCFFFGVVDEFFEGKTSPCYCVEREKVQEGEEEKKEDSSGESGLLESLHGRKKSFRKMGLLKVSKISGNKGPFCGDKKNRWSDCGCESCLSLMNNGSEYRLHFVVREPETGIKIEIKVFD